MVLPESGGLGDERIDNHHVFQFCQRARRFVFIREGRQRVKPLYDVAIDFAFQHQFGLGHHIIETIPLWQPVIAPVVVSRGMLAPEAFHHADEELRRILPVVDCVQAERRRRDLRDIGLVIRLFFRR